MAKQRVHPTVLEPDVASLPAVSHGKTESISNSSRTRPARLHAVSHGKM